MSMSLYPPIGIIRSDLLATPPPPKAPPSELDRVPQSAEMPGFLASMVRRRIMTQDAFPLEPPSVGQIRRLGWIPNGDSRGRLLGRTYGVLLGASQGDGLWSGWIVAQEVDYASNQDLVLQEENGPLSPDAAMVQTWNPVRLKLHGDEIILGKLSPECLACVGFLAEIDTEFFVAPRPGRIGTSILPGGSTIVTGTPIGGPSDPRREYQELYGNLALEIAASSIRQPNKVIPIALARLFGQLNQLFVRPVWTFGAIALALAQGVWIVLSGSLPPEDPSVYRSASMLQKTDRCGPRIRIIFKQDTPYTDLVILLRRIEGTMVDGPSETGEVWVTLSQDQESKEAASVLKLSPFVESVDEIPSDHRSCTP